MIKIHECVKCDQRIYWSGVFGMWVHVKSAHERCEGSRSKAAPKK